MKAIILAGGYATRLWPLTKHIPKVLLPVCGKPIIDFILDQIKTVDGIDKVIVSTNKRFENHFRYWLRGIPQQIKINVEIAIEPTTTEAQKMGSVGAIGYLVEQEGLTDSDLLIIAGDNLFEFRLVDFVDFYRRQKAAIVAFCDLESVDKVRGKYGVGELNEEHKVVAFQEKPEQPTSTLASTGCYLYPASVVEYLQDYLKGNNSRDALGHFVDWLHRRVNVYGFVFREAWYDIGSFESYDQVNEDYRFRVRI